MVIKSKPAIIENVEGPILKTRVSEPTLVKQRPEINLSRGKLDIMTKASATFFLQVTKAWDHGNKRQREAILQDFCKLGTESLSLKILEEQLLNGASLFFTRITSWFRLSYMLEECNLTLLLEAISVFLGCTSNNKTELKYINEFLEVGGILTVVEVLNLSFASDENKISALKVIINFANAGIVYKEVLCECRAIDHLVECLTNSRTDQVFSRLKDALICIGNDNQKFNGQIYKAMLTILTSPATSSKSQHYAGLVIRQLISQIPQVHQSVVDALVNLLKSPHETTQLQAYEILKIVSTRTGLQHNLIRVLVIITKLVVEGMKELQEEGKKGSGHDMIAAAYMQQYYAVKLLGVMAAREPQLANEMLDMQILNGLLNCVANMNHKLSQKAAIETVLYFIDLSNEVVEQIQTQIGQEFYDMLIYRPDSLIKELTPLQLHLLRQNKTQIDMPVTEQKQTFENDQEENDEFDESPEPLREQRRVSADRRDSISERQDSTNSRKSSVKFSEVEKNASGDKRRSTYYARKQSMRKSLAHDEDVSDLDSGNYRLRMQIEKEHKLGIYVPFGSSEKQSNSGKILPHYKFSDEKTIAAPEEEELMRKKSVDLTKETLAELQESVKRMLDKK